MDRPEDIEVNPVSGNVYMVMTNNTFRGTDERPATDAANPRPTNAFGHIIETVAAGGDHAEISFTDDTALFASIQHPGEGGNLAATTSTWPTGSLALPAVVVASHTRLAEVGSA